jgi:AcrR family transcriptional regulator
MTRHPGPRDIRIADIIDAALHEFREKGYDQVTLSDIARRANIPRTTIYRYFPNREALLTAVNNRIFEPVQALIAACGSLPTPASRNSISWRSLNPSATARPGPSSAPA